MTLGKEIVQTKLAHLTYETTDDLGLSFRLMLDGDFVGEMFHDKNSGIPYWCFDEDLPSLRQQKDDSALHYVAVCDCGEYGCGQTAVWVKKEKDVVTITEHLWPAMSHLTPICVAVDRKNYDQVIAEICLLAAEKRKNEEA